MYPGCFEMNLDRKTINFKAVLPCEDVPTYETLTTFFAVGPQALNTFGDGLLEVMFGMKSAKDAFDEARAKMR